jgi:hypothetical protein
MGILDNDTVIVDAILTKIGRQKLANGQPLSITKFAFGDTGVDYTLYNPNHPSGSDSYGTAITSLPMLEAVPDDNVFLRSKLWGTGERNIQNFSFIQVENTSVTIAKIPSETESFSVMISPTIFPRNPSATYDFKILDYRGVQVMGASGNGGETGGYGNATMGATRGRAGATTAENGGITVVSDISNPAYDHPDPVVAHVNGQQVIELNARAQQITSQKSFGVEITPADASGAAPAFVTVTMEQNNIA